MSPPARQPTPVRSLLAKLVIGASIVVALADSPPPTWHTSEEWGQRVALDEQRERRFLLTIELGGELYADTRRGDVSIWAAADRAASDLTLAWRVPIPPEEPEGSDPALFPEDTLADAGPGGAAPDAATWPATNGWVSRSPNPGAADRIGMGFDLVCADRSQQLPGELRPETCIEQFELSLARGSERTLSAALDVGVTISGQAQRQPAGTFQIRVEELVP